MDYVFGHVGVLELGRDASGEEQECFSTTLWKMPSKERVLLERFC